MDRAQDIRIVLGAEFVAEFERVVALADARIRAHPDSDSTRLVGFLVSCLLAVGNPTEQARKGLGKSLLDEAAVMLATSSLSVDDHARLVDRLCEEFRSDCTELKSRSHLS